MSWLSKALGFFANPIADVIGGWTERKRVAAVSAADIAKAEADLKIAKFKAKAKRFELDASMDQDYDMQVLKNRDSSFADELIIIIWFAVFLMHFIPSTQTFMAAGWVAMGYVDGPAWWFEFGMVGILVSTLGLMRVLKLMIGRVRRVGPDAAGTSRVLSGGSP